MARFNNTKRIHRITLRLTDHEIDKLRKLLSKSRGDHTLSQLIRRMLFDKELTVNTRNASLEEVKNELILMRTEIRRVGVNINQVVHYFNAQREVIDKVKYAREVASLYQPMVQLSDSLITHLDGTLRLWLPK
ncbi:mobilization protein MobC [Roseivirga sp. BDSF3-8]|uniref:plasmid mobilization protein n=1 Tax=Roseivirga sp. BDSF3-8 TaxID=3241598 RepID=UPI0035318855